jgi:hypothetical protein
MGIVILVCATAISAADCIQQTATHVLRAPVVAIGAGGCMMQGMLYAARSNSVNVGYYPKILCVSGPPAAQALRK